MRTILNWISWAVVVAVTIVWGGGMLYATGMMVYWTFKIDWKFASWVWGSAMVVFLAVIYLLVDEEGI